MALSNVIRMKPRVKRKRTTTDVHDGPASQRDDARSKKTRDAMRKVAKSIARQAVRHSQDSFEDRYFERKLERFDTWKNAITKLGVSGDKRLGGQFSTDRMVDLECEDLWRGSDMAATAVETVPDAIERAGFELLIKAVDKKKTDRRERGDLLPTAGAMPPKNVEAEDDTAKEIAEAMEEQAEELNIIGTLAEALKAERGYGGAAIFPGIRDGVKDLSKPLDLNRVQSVDWLDVLTPLELIPYQWYSNPVDAKYGTPELYWMQRIPTGNIGTMQRVPIHETRLIRFGGVAVSRRQLREHWGWGDSVLVRMNEVLRDFDASWQGAAILLSDFAQMVISIKGLAESFATGDDNLLVDRARALDEGRSIARAVIIDAEETAERKSTPVTGMPELLDRFCNRLAAAARMPVTLLMGQAPAGLNATGDSDIRNFFDRVAADRKIKLSPKLRQLFKLLFSAKKGPTKGKEPAKWGISWGPMWQLSDTEQATRRKAIADADAEYVNAGVLLPEEVAKSRFGGTEYSADTQLDRDLREQFDKQAEEEAQVQAAALQAAAENTGGEDKPAGGEGGGKQPPTRTGPAPKDAAKKSPGPKVPVGKDQKPGAV